MKLSRVKIMNFRLLQNVELALENQTTVVVGRNNSGKTSLSEIIRRFASDKNPAFKIQDFSIDCYDDFCAALKAKNEGKQEDEIRQFLPKIELRMYFQYDPNIPQLGPLGEFVVDLDMDCNEALVVMCFELQNGAISRFFEALPEGDLNESSKMDFFRELAERIPKLFTINVWAEDPNDPENRKESTQAAVKALLKTGFINAQRGLDDETTRESDVLAKILETLFTTASLETADDNEKKIAIQLEEAVQGIQDSIDGDFQDQLKQLLPTLQTLGYPGLGGSELTTETTLDVQRLLKNHTKVRYEGHNGIKLPESYNGLGMRNLIFILLQVHGFFREFRAQSPVPGLHLVFIEEPEAHLHPQMQEVFIRQLGEIVAKLNAAHGNDPDWPVQFIVSTHSPHIANEATFESIRYFLPSKVEEKSDVWKTRIKDLNRWFAEIDPESKEPIIDPGDKKFLHQYLTLTRCDLFFADKIILIEGTSERMILPVMIQKHDEFNPDAPKLRSQYLTTMEVGGAYAHKFFKLLNFLELQSLVITDLDAVEETGGKSCLVHNATATSNACINTWFDKKDCEPAKLINKSADERSNGLLYLTYQCPEEENGPCGRTFEDAFLLANSDKFSIAGDAPDKMAEDAFKKAKRFKKTEFALKYAIDDTDWVVPSYIANGLKWLAIDYVVPDVVEGADD
ncbi:ATP-dependent endonuclease [Rhodobacterales bacterium 52_120_T64]|nr:ATP-dependent endonuclease [Rhodobacterales bacterium 52_120_T64]